MLFSLYPYHNFSDYNLDYVIRKVKELTEKIDNFVSFNSIKYADPLDWNITKQYEANTVVIDPTDGNAYLSLQPVPLGVNITNDEYWTPIFNYNASLDELREELKELIETSVNVKYFDSLNEAISGNCEEGDCVITGGYRTFNDRGGFKYAVGSTSSGIFSECENGLYLNLIIEGAIVPEMFGAYGDGQHDDTAAVQSAVNYAINNGLKFGCSSGALYLISETITINKQIVADLSGGRFRCNAPYLFDIGNGTLPYACDGSSILNLWVVSCRGGIRVHAKRIRILNCYFYDNSNTAIWVEGGTNVSYEVVVDNCCFNNTAVSANSIAVQFDAGDCIFTNSTGYGQHRFIVNGGGSNYFENLHAWPIESDTDTRFFEDRTTSPQNSKLARLYSDYYHHMFHFTLASATIPKFRPESCLIAVRGNNEVTHLLYFDRTENEFTEALVDVEYGGNPSNLVLSNVNGMVMNMLKETTITATPGANTYIDAQGIKGSGGRFHGFLTGTVNTGSTTTGTVRLTNCKRMYCPFALVFVDGACIRAVSAQDGNDAVFTWTMPQSGVGYKQYLFYTHALEIQYF